ncbi:hypothetical protein FG91_03765 [Sphingopyxis sp. LC81]|uniref:hypothetical protein n=1 Tax=Sphingopyxis sp. LC81 TaxID=1502850 RepID=UPI00050F24E5|nr:hypothetical protein [Sphingopyxis sp. LC81]KGB52131.1 hypothetical protein FG91_03765 [Sphingopyxis sp. LC81]
MAFRPFGFAFELRTPLDLAESKRRIRQCKQPWYDPSDGPRGFIVGRFICLWSSVVQSQGPMLIGRIRDDGMGCRIAGRSGSDINGMLYLALTGVLLAVVAAGLYRDGQMGPSAAMMLALCAVALILLLWSASRERRAGLVLVDFVELTLGSDARHEFR